MARHVWMPSRGKLPVAGRAATTYHGPHMHMLLIAINSSLSRIYSLWIVLACPASAWPGPRTKQPKASKPISQEANKPGSQEARSQHAEARKPKKPENQKAINSNQRHTTKNPDNQNQDPRARNQPETIDSRPAKFPRF